MADDRDSLLREVDEELRREQMQKIWERYNGLILGGAALIVVAVGGYQYLESRRIADAQVGGSKFAAALQLSEDKKDEDAAKAFSEIAASGPKGYATLAKLHVAGDHAKAGRTAEAVAAYEGIANASGGDSLLKNFAQLQVASLKLGEADYTEQQNRLTPLATDGSAFKTTARELLGLAAFKAGKFDEARKYFEPLLIDPQASRAIQERVKIVMGEIARAEGGIAPASKPEAAAPAAAPEPAKADAPAAPAQAEAATPAEPKPENATTEDTKPAEPDQK
jgi:hypothetical protein